jgi:molecular chaperone Hsp33
MTIDQGGDMSRYQGLVALEGGTLEDAAHEYFLRSEQIPTRVRLAVAEEFRAATGGPSHRWRAGGLLLQFVPRAPERARVPDLDPGDAPEGAEKHVVSGGRCLDRGPLARRTIEDIELIDPAVSLGAAALSACSMSAGCACSARPSSLRSAPAHARALRLMLRSFPQSDRDDMVENGVISVTCEFCSQTYVFEPSDVADDAVASSASAWSPVHPARRSGSRCRTARPRPTPCRSCRS